MANGQETVLSEDAFLMSQTDDKGNIIYANAEFCRIAEYKVEELLGHPHSIVRHKDMPKAAFEDLWKTVKSGEVWSGYVKNITASKGYYWVFATVYPYFDESGRQCYLSCRRKADKKKIDEHIALYKTMM